MLQSLTHILSDSQKKKTKQRKALGPSHFPRSAQSKGGFAQDCFDFISLIQSWQEIVGPVLSKSSVPLKIQYRNLVIATKHSAFASEMNFMAPKILEKVVKRWPSLKNLLDGLSFQVKPQLFSENQTKNSGHGFTEQVKKSMERSLHHPQSPHYQEIWSQSQEMFRDIEDDEIRELLASLAIQQSQAKKS